ncbi:hypothetical protein B0I32_11950 [Nonomuraea fuscirosea]|uniref:DDE family transposase n=1 Tax=Nonomuraea fuscirosea TaxID=1291556 RepID=A0A2T0MNN8_9ACTN|nr:hypothetical protein B0I32_11950 [Nonomuraea fuscirosea]
MRKDAVCRRSCRLQLDPRISLARLNMDAVHRRFLAALVAHTPVLPEAARFAYLDVDDTIRATHGYAKQGAGYG